MNEFLEQFLIEGRELIEQATGDLLALERQPVDQERLDGVFRAIHTLKGGAGIVDFEAMSTAMHAAEDVLSATRAGERPLTARLIQDCQASLDQAARWLDDIEATGDLPSNADASVIVARFDAGGPNTASSPDATIEPRDDFNTDADGISTSEILKEQLRVIAGGGPGRIASAGRLAVNVLRHLERLEEASALEALIAEKVEAEPLARMIERAIQQTTAHPAPRGESRSESIPRTLRVDTGRVEMLVGLTEELSVCGNAFGQLAKLARDADSPLAGSIAGEHAKLDRLLSGLRTSVMELRMLPVRSVFQRFSRLVRETSVTLGKSIRLSMDGEDTEADKAIIEMLAEPLLHVVRNAIDHGIETPDERLRHGKSATANIWMSARRERNNIVIEVRDDGRGIDPANVRAAALARRVVTAASLDAMSDEDIVNLVFTPGFSTAGTVSDLSGRGVGMDAVRVAIGRLGGSVSLCSRKGEGCAVTFVLPVTAITTSVVTVRSAGRTYGIPIEIVVETSRLHRDRIFTVGAARALIFRDRTIAFINLSEALGQEPPPPVGEATIIVVEADGETVALEVDHLGERIDTMLKPPGNLLAGLPYIAGTALLGDGGVLVILNIREVLEHTVSPNNKKSL